MQIAHVIHAVSAVVMIVLACDHVSYMGTIGMEARLPRHARWLRRTRHWAREHHEIWYDIQSGKIHRPALHAP